jgi:hypothetical protein
MSTQRHFKGAEPTRLSSYEKGTPSTPPAGDAVDPSIHLENRKAHTMRTILIGAQPERWLRAEHGQRSVVKKSPAKKVSERA